ncbi:hypothetical protein HYY74_06235 [Candidatus Woesearchaeota archaeon]|nr:hypothetical protein [Candidatus Woesearchaeota archaeon]
MAFTESRFLWACVIAVITLLLASFVNIGIEPLTSMAAAAPSPDIVILDKVGFSPKEILIRPGETVVWRNDMQRVSVLWSPSPNATFRSGVLYTGDTYSYTFDREGTYRYVDVNWGWKGAVIVQATAPTPAEAPPIPAPEPEETICATCPSGCSRNVDDCSRCDCPCYWDSDCDDNDICTVDVCSTEPVGCASTRKPGCSYGQPVAPEPASLAAHPPVPSLKPSGLVILAGLIILGILGFVLYSTFKVKPRKRRR